MTDALVAFIQARFTEELESTRHSTKLMATQSERLGVPAEAAARHARFSIATAEARLALLEDTVVPYLRTAGPGGRNAEYQLRLLAAPYMEHREYPHDEPGRPA